MINKYSKFVSKLNKQRNNYTNILVQLLKVFCLRSRHLKHFI